MDPVRALELQNRAIRKPFGFDFIERAASRVLHEQLRRNEVTIVLGARQVGKTSLLKRLLLDREASHGSDTVLYINMDSQELQSGFESPLELAAYVQAKGYGAGKLIIIDEIQRLPEPGLYLKQLYDLDLGAKLMVSGSSSLAIRSKTREHLTGRRRMVHLSCLRFDELARHHGLIGVGEGSLPVVSTAISSRLESLVDELACFGGYPAVHNETDPIDKEQVIRQLYADYVRRDVADFMGVRNTRGYNSLVRGLAGQVGGLCNQVELSRLTGLDVKTVKKHLDILEHTYVVHVLRPWGTNPRTEVKKSPKCYFADNGLLNSNLGRFASISARADRGGLVENMVIAEMKKVFDDRVRFWRSTSGAEVDLIFDLAAGPLPVEIKSTALKRPKVSRSFRSFLKKYRPQVGYILHRGPEMSATVEGIEVRFLPIWQAFLQLDSGEFEPSR